MDMKRNAILVEVFTLLLLLLGVAESVVGWCQLTGVTRSHHSLYPATGTFYNPGPYCGFLGVVLPVALAAMVGGRERVMRWAGAVCLLLAGGIMPALMGRTGWLAGAAGCAVVWWGLRDPIRIGRGMKVSLAVVLCGALWALWWLKPDSAMGRLWLWRCGLAASLDHPLTGVGWSRVGGALGDAQEAYFSGAGNDAFSLVAGSPEYAFNEFIQTGIAFGLPAMLLLVALMYALTAVALRERVWGAAGATVAFAVVCLSSYPLRFAEFAVAMTLVALVTVVQWGQRRPAACAVGAVVILAAGSAWTVWAETDRRADAEGRRLAAAVRAPLSGEAVARLDSLIEEGGAGGRPQLLFAYGKALRESGMMERSNAVLEHGLEVSSDPMFLNLLGRNRADMGRREEAAICFRRSAARLPGRLYPRFLLASMLAASGDSVGFERECEGALTMWVKVESAATADMRRRLLALRDSVRGVR